MNSQVVDGSRPKAEGVIFYDANGRKHTAYLNNASCRASEIVLSAGAIGSPQLLMLSGIGPAARLHSLGIEVVLDQPLVGQDMADNPLYGLIMPYTKSIPLSTATVVGILDKIYIETVNGYDFSSLSVGSAAPTQSSTAFQEAAANSTTNLGFILGKFKGPISEGYLQLQSTNVSDNPNVRFNYYQAEEDLRRCVHGMKAIIDVLNSESLSSYRFRNTTTRDLLEMMVNMPVNLRPRHPNATTSLEQYCIDTVMTFWHYHGGCRIGKVVGRDYKVIGVESLRVIDASTFVFSPGTNPQATIMMLGR
ncbi:hypothetical protein V6N13_022851 [Hibiscus sabdariffa]